MKATVTIGIPAYNASAFITKALSSLASQLDEQYIVERIVVIDDGSTDATSDIVRQFADDRVTLIVHDQREGKAACINELSALAKSEVLILMDPESCFETTSVLDSLIASLYENKHVKLAAGAAVPYPGTTFIEKAVALRMDRYRSRAIDYKNGNNLYTATSRLLAIHRDLYEHMRVPKTIFAAERYIYLACVTEGYSYRFAPSATVYYRAAHTAEAYALRQARTLGTRSALQYHFPTVFIDKQYRLPHATASTWRQFIEHPLYVLTMFGLDVYCSILAFGEKYKQAETRAHDLITKEIH